jgi:hypothetical protein
MIAAVVAGCGVVPGISRKGPGGEPSRVPGSAQWHAQSGPLAVEYLTTLPDRMVGQTLTGIALSDGQRWLEGFTFVGRVRVDHPGLWVVVIESPEGDRKTFMWIEEAGEPLPLEICEPTQQGVRARVLSGEIYTWRALRPGDGIVSTDCPPVSWAVYTLGRSGAGEAID